MSTFVTDLLGKTLAVLTMRGHSSDGWWQRGTGVVRACALADGKLTVTLEVVDGDPDGGGYTTGDLVTIEPLSCEYPTKFRVEESC